MSFDGITRTALERATAGIEGARHIGSQLSGYAGTNVQTLMEAIIGRVLPSGGTTGQALTKSSGTDYAVSWTTASGASPPFADNTALVKDDADATKLVRVDAGTVATSTTRVLTMPNADVDLTGDVSFPAMSTFNARDFKNSVRAATTAAGTLATSFENGDAIDGVTLATGNRILIKNQAAGAENGIYTVNASGAPTRATDADTSAKVTSGQRVPVEEGTANTGKVFYLSTTGAITLGTTALTFSDALLAHATNHNPGGTDVIQRFGTIYWVFDGVLAVTTGSKQVPIFIPTGSNTPTLVSAAARITTAPTGSAVTFDLNKAGTTVWTGGTNRLTVAAAGNGGSTTTFDVSTFASLDYYTVDIDTVGSTTAGTHAVFALTYRY